MTAALGLALALGGCLGTTPYEATADALGPEPGGEPGPNHRPGQPCLACHGADYSPGNEVFALAGTAYDTVDGPVGLAGVEVTVADSLGHTIVLRSNRAGNFYANEGRNALVYPLFVKIEAAGQTQVMETPIEREGSCAYCHTREPGARSNGPIYVHEVTP